jgi:uroporphyrin-III C-methyltransferase / precorrin-2 dehydrogenase / sirohydrochlorin ferrochelatase
VYLVGAGPGDADLLTLRALRLMQQSDVVVFDGAVGPDVLDRVRRDAERIDAGAQPVSEVNAAMLREARAGKRVLRLVSGRGASGAEYFLRHGIEVVSVPGVAAVANVEPLKVASW